MMTLVIGIKSREGIVLGADGAATLGRAGLQTVQQRCKKLEVLGPNIVFGSSGQIGFSQKLTAEIGERYKSEYWYKKHSLTFRKMLEKALVPHFKWELESAAPLGHLGLQQVLSQAFVALPLGDDTAHLYEINERGTTEEKTEAVPFASIGSGQQNADPFLAFLRDIYWPDRLPNLSEATFVALWALRFCIRFGAGIGEPIQIITLAKSDEGNWEATELTEDMLKEHREAIKRAEDALRDFRTGFQQKQKVAEGLLSPSEFK